MTQPSIRALEISEYFLKKLRKCEQVPFIDDEGREIFYGGMTFKWNTVLSYFVAKKYKDSVIIVVVNGEYGACKALLVPNELFNKIKPGKVKFKKAVFAQWRLVSSWRNLEHGGRKLSTTKTNYSEDIIELKRIINRLNLNRRIIVDIDKEELITDHREILKEYVRTIP